MNIANMINPILTNQLNQWVFPRIRKSLTLKKYYFFAKLTLANTARRVKKSSEFLALLAILIALVK